MRLKFTPLVSLLAVFTLIQAALGTASIAAQSDKDVKDIVTNASSTIASSTSIHFKLQVEGDSFVDPAGTIRLMSAEGDLVRPDKVNVEFQVQILGTANVTIKMVTIGAKSWTTDILTGNWGPAPAEFGYDPTVLFDTNNGLGPVISKLSGLKVEDTEKIDGRSAYRISGIGSKKDIALLTAETMTGSSYKVDIWVDGENSQLLKITLAEPSDNGKKNPATWTMNISNYDADVTVEAPV